MERVVSAMLVLKRGVVAFVFFFQKTNCCCVCFTDATSFCWMIMRGVLLQAAATALVFFFFLLPWSFNQPRIPIIEKKL
jgi:hypothetical protein